MLNEERQKTALMLRVTNSMLTALAVFLMWQAGVPLLLASIINHHSLAMFTIVLTVLCIFFGGKDNTWWGELQLQLENQKQEVAEPRRKVAPF